MKFFNIIKLSFCIILMFFIHHDELFTMERSLSNSSSSLQEKVFNSLGDLDGLQEIIQKISKFLFLPPEITQDLNEFILCNNFAFVRIMTLNFLAKTRHYVSMISELSERESLNIRMQPMQRTLNKKGKLLTAGVDGVLNSIDLMTDEMISKHMQNRAFSCITSKSDILVLAQEGLNVINILNLSDFSEIGFLKTKTPTVYIKIINNLMIVLNSAGEIDFYSWPLGIRLSNLRTGIMGMIVNASWNKNFKAIFISTTRGRYMISLSNIIDADYLLHKLSMNQLFLIPYVIQNMKTISLESLSQNEAFRSLPEIFQEMIRYLYTKLE